MESLMDGQAAMTRMEELAELNRKVLGGTFADWCRERRLKLADLVD